MVALGLTSLVQPKGLLEVAECGQHVSPGDIHQDGDGTASLGLECAGVGALCPPAHLLTLFPCIFPVGGVGSQSVPPKHTHSQHSSCTCPGKLLLLVVGGPM